MKGFMVGVQAPNPSDLQVEMTVRWPEGKFDPEALRAKATAVVAEAFMEIDRRETSND